MKALNSPSSEARDTLKGLQVDDKYTRAITKILCGGIEHNINCRTGGEFLTYRLRDWWPSYYTIFCETQKGATPVPPGKKRVIAGIYPSLHYKVDIDIPLTRLSQVAGALSTWATAAAGAGIVGAVIYVGSIIFSVLMNKGIINVAGGPSAELAGGGLGLYLSQLSNGTFASLVDASSKRVLVHAAASGPFGGASYVEWVGPKSTPIELSLLGNVPPKYSKGMLTGDTRPRFYQEVNFPRAQGWSGVAGFVNTIANKQAWRSRGCPASLLV